MCIVLTIVICNFVIIIIIIIIISAYVTLYNYRHCILDYDYGYHKLYTKQRVCAHSENSLRVQRVVLTHDFTWSSITSSLSVSLRKNRDTK